MIGKLAGRTADRAGAGSSETHREWSAAYGPAPFPAPPRRAALARSLSCSRLSLGPAS